MDDLITYANNIESDLMDEKIVSLLNNNLRVIIPDFGAFIIRQQEPRIVVFNEMLKNNDGLLLDYIIRKENVEQEIASQLLNDYTTQAYKILDSGNTFTIDGLGELQRDSYGRINFRPSDNNMVSAAENPAPVQAEHPAAEPAVDAAHDILSKPRQAEVITRTLPSTPLIPKQLLMWILMIVAANAVVVIFFLLKDHKESKSVRAGKSTILSQPVVDQLADSMMAAVADTTLHVTTGNEQANPEAPSEEDLRYYIVAGCFRDEINAEELVDSLKAIGYRAEKFGKIGDLYAVSFASFDNKDLAVKELDRIRKEHHPDAWMTRF